MRQPQRHTEAGFTVIEVLVAALVVTIALAGTMLAMGIGASAQARDWIGTSTQSIANRELERAKADNLWLRDTCNATWRTQTGTFTPCTRTFVARDRDGRQFDVNVRVVPVDSDEDSTGPARAKTDPRMNGARPNHDADSNSRDFYDFSVRAEIQCTDQNLANSGVTAAACASRNGVTRPRTATTRVNASAMVFDRLGSVAATMCGFYRKDTAAAATKCRQVTTGGDWGDGSECVPGYVTYDKTTGCRGAIGLSGTITLTPVGGGVSQSVNVGSGKGVNDAVAPGDYRVTAPGGASGQGTTFQLLRVDPKVIRVEADGFVQVHAAYYAIGVAPPIVCFRVTHYILQWPPTVLATDPSPRPGAPADRWLTVSQGMTAWANHNMQYTQTQQSSGTTWRMWSDRPNRWRELPVNDFTILWKELSSPVYETRRVQGLVNDPNGNNWQCNLVPRLGNPYEGGGGLMPLAKYAIEVDTREGFLHVAEATGRLGSCRNTANEKYLFGTDLSPDFLPVMEKFLPPALDGQGYRRSWERFRFDPVANMGQNFICVDLAVQPYMRVFRGGPDPVADGRAGCSNPGLEGECEAVDDRARSCTMYDPPDVEPVPSEDLNGNGLLDGSEDLNGNGILDDGEDVNGNGVLDGTEDANGNGVLDLGTEGSVTPAFCDTDLPQLMWEVRWGDTGQGTWLRECTFAGAGAICDTITRWYMIGGMNAWFQNRPPNGMFEEPHTSGNSGGGTASG